MELYFYLLLTLIIAKLSVVYASVQFDLALRPRIVPKQRDWNGTIFRNISSDEEFQMICLAPYPTQWVFASDPKYQILMRAEWTDSTIISFKQNIRHYYKAHYNIKLSYVNTFMVLKCKAVHDDKDYLLIQLIPYHDTVQLLIRNESFDDPNPVVPIGITSSCKVKMSFIYSEGSYYARCILNQSDIVPKVDNHLCMSSPLCFNEFLKWKALRVNCKSDILREISLYEVGMLETGTNNCSKKKLEKDFETTKNTCTEVIPDGPIIKDRWWKLVTPHAAGIVLCLTDGEFVGAQEYFFSAPDPVSRKRTIHFSWSEVQPNKMLWLTPSSFANTYYNGQNINSTCNVPIYGFSLDMRVIVRFNNKDILDGINVVGELIANENFTRGRFDLKLNRSGSYEIICMARFWNTTELANRSVNFFVKDPVPPYFDQPIETITFTEGDEEKKIWCAAQGDPTPQVKWIPPENVKPITVKGASLHIPRVTNLIDGEYSCIASNGFGTPAIKTVKIRVSNKDINTTAIAIGTVVAVIMIVFLTSAYIFTKFQNKVIRLTAQEVLEFRQGKVATTGEPVETNFISSLSYDIRFELSRSKFQVDTKQALGSGTFGIVYKGTVKTENGFVEAAFKTIRNDADATKMKALLAELKILIYLGNHESIVNLIGAWTERIENGEIFMVVELCNCCLLNFLRENSSGFLNFVKDGVITSDFNLNAMVYQTIQGSQQFTTFSLIQWSREIAAGLEFIETKHVIHGDIAARNILLTSKLGAKLSDFGLARQLANYTYIKSEQRLLPWKWMAIESLRNKGFSIKSDVWSFGISMWEIFMLGGIPYPGLTWSNEFVTKLEEGQRLPPPPNAPLKLWNIMLECWHSNPDARPTFTSIKACLESFPSSFNCR